MKCDIQPRTIYEISLDGEAIGTIEKALAYYRDRAILPDDSPGAELSRQFTALLMKLKTGVSDATPEQVSLPEIPEPDDDLALEAPEEPVDAADDLDAPAVEEDAEETAAEDVAIEEEEYLAPEIEPLDGDAAESFCARCGRNPVNAVAGQNICEVCERG
jgi:hypothetical protein